MRENKEVERMLSSNTKLVEEATGALSRLFRQILLDANVGKMLWGALMDRYLKDPRNRINQAPKDISSARGNLAKELVRTDMTWKVFNKAIRFLNPRNVKISVTIEWQRGRTTVHEVQIYKSLTTLGNDPKLNRDAVGEGLSPITVALDKNLEAFKAYQKGTGEKE